MAMLHYEYPPARWPHLIQNALKNECLQHTKKSDYQREIDWYAFDNGGKRGGVTSMTTANCPFCNGLGWNGI